MKIGDVVTAVIHERVTVNGVPQCSEPKGKNPPLPLWKRSEKEAIIEKLSDKAERIFNVTILVGDKRYYIGEENIKPKKGGLGF